MFFISEFCNFLFLILNQKIDQSVIVPEFFFMIVFSLSFNDVEASGTDTCFCDTFSGG